MIRFSILIVGIFLLTGCENDIPDFERTNFKINGQEFEILSTKGIFNNYVNKYKNYKDFSQASIKWGIHQNICGKWCEPTFGQIALF